MTDKKEISEIIKAANSYLNCLSNLDRKIEKAEQQICDTSAETEELINSTFITLVENLTNILSSRRDTLIKKVQKMKAQSLVSLEECRLDIGAKIEKSNTLINEGAHLLSNYALNSDEYSEKSSFLGNLPEIPELKEVPYITFQYEQNQESKLLDACSRFGEVSRMAPVQISQMSEKPGAIQVEWSIIDSDERCVDIEEFRLQKAFGDVINQKHLTANFHDCFTGLETQFLVKYLRENQPYSFRVCCKFEGATEWSPWSLPQVAQTSLKSFSWGEHADFVLANDGRIATSVQEGVLASDGPQFAVGYSVEFTYLEFVKSFPAIIGLVVADSISNISSFVNLTNVRFFSVSSTGEICVDGVKKATKLPEATKGLKICFTCEYTHDNKVLVNLDSCEKRVTYNWTIQPQTKIHFAAQFGPTTKLMVE